MSYLLDPLLSMLMVALPSQLMECFWYLSCSQVIQQYLHWIQPTEPQQTSKTPFPSALSSCIAFIVGPPMKTSHHATSTTIKDVIFRQYNE